MEKLQQTGVSNKQSATLLIGYDKEWRVCKIDYLN